MGALERARSAVLDALDRTTEERIGLLQKLVRIPSPEGEGKRILGAVASQLERLGAEKVDLFQPDLKVLREHPGYSPSHPDHSSSRGGTDPVLVATYEGAGGGRSIMFYGHMELSTPSWEPAVVAQMTIDPFAGVVRNGRLYGRGAYNMKSGNVAAIFAMALIRRLGIRLQGDVLLNFNTDEDVGSNGALASVLRGYRADGGINPEPTSLWICPTTGGPMWFRIEVIGRSAFAGWSLAVNAIDKAILIYKTVQDYAEYRRKTARHVLYDKLPNPAPLGVGVFRAGNWPSNTPQVAIIEGRIGCLPGEDLAAIREEFEMRIREVSERDGWLRDHPPKVLWTAIWEPVITEIDHPIVTTAASVFRTVTGTAPVISGKTAGNDMTKLTAYGNVPSINWGPIGGPFGYRHGAAADPEAEGFDEYVELSSFHTLTKLYAVMLLEWCGITN
ncbi:MAG: M20/M25/M40 family metallo-hydrolase [Armatimonadota bacterium]